MSGIILLLNTVITDIYGKPVKIQDGENPIIKTDSKEFGSVCKEEPNFKDLTLRDAIRIGLDKQVKVAQYDSADILAAEIDMYEVIIKVQAAEDTLEITNQQFKLIEKDVAKYWGNFGRTNLGKVMEALNKRP